MSFHPPKKHFGQHFLKEKSIAEKICNSLQGVGKQYHKLLEIGPGQGVLTQFLYQLHGENLHLVEIDKDLVPNLKKNYPLIANQVYELDFLELNLAEIFTEQVGIIGNFPYNISSQILFKLVENRALVPEMVGMFQREVSQRVIASPGNKIYGLLSAWLQVFYDCEYLFTVNEGSFNPPPKVKSGVIRLTRKAGWDNIGVSPDLLLQVIKQAFGMRRKTLRNALKLYAYAYIYVNPDILDKRAETLSFQDFIDLAKIFEEHRG
ncbi:MAG: 16S rRNA (adenine(1518)-N(6)/adenine(1519)-N(6))-dimethyltransferase RsmA [Bacteroidia bacterium]